MRRHDRREASMPAGSGAPPGLLEESEHSSASSWNDRDRRLVDQDVVCLSISPWDGPITSTAHQLMRHVAQRNRVLFVERPLTALDLARAALGRAEDQPWDRERRRRTLGGSPRLREVGPNLHVLTPPPAPSINFLPDGPLYRSGLAATGAIAAASIRRAMRTLSMRDPVLWVAFEVPTGLAIADRIGARLVVYHAYDLITGEAYVARHGEALERELVERAQLVVTTSTMLQQRMSEQCGRKARRVPNGVDHALFARALDLATEVPAEVAALPKPVLGYVGALEDRVDWSLLARVADAHPHGTLLLVGPVKSDHRGHLEELARRPNVVHLAPRPQDQLPAVLKGVDVGLIPFVASPQTSAIYPLKLNEYLAAGKPVVATPFSSDVRAFEGLAEVASPEAFLPAVRRALVQATSPGAAHARSRAVLAHDWAARAAEVEDLLVTTLSEHPLASAPTHPLPGPRTARRPKEA